MTAPDRIWAGRVDGFGWWNEAPDFVNNVEYIRRDPAVLARDKTVLAMMRTQHVSYHAAMCAKADALRKDAKHDLAHAVEEASRLTFYELGIDLGLPATEVEP